MLSTTWLPCGPLIRIVARRLSIHPSTVHPPMSSMTSISGAHWRALTSVRARSVRTITAFSPRYLPTSTNSTFSSDGITELARRAAAAPDLLDPKPSWFHDPAKLRGSLGVVER